jgi:hypothetical protein
MNFLFFRKENETKLILILFFISLLMSTLILFRGVITPMGLESFGRTWQFYVNYNDFGFVRRAFLGTFLHNLGLNNFFENTYYNSYMIHASSILILSVMLLHYSLTRRPFESPYLYVFVFLSPSLILHQGYLTGTLDTVLLILAFVSVFYVRRWSSFLVISIVGVLIHEIYLFIFPVLLFIQSRKFYSYESGYIKLATKFWPLMSIVLISITVLAIVFFAADINEAEYVKIMSQYINSNIVQARGIADGYFEVFSSVERNSDIGLRMISDMNENLIYISMPLLMVVVLGYYLSGSSRELLDKLMIFVVILFPLLISFLATDFYRWVSLSLNASILLLLYLGSVRKLNEKFVNPVLFLPFVFFISLGAAGLERPFPIWQFLIERLI